MADTRHSVYLTGSNANMLSRDIQTTPGGRYIPVDAYPHIITTKINSNHAEHGRAQLQMSSIVRRGLTAN
jgi:hypothetical protein